jgi:hypothetical protein
MKKIYFLSLIAASLLSCTSQIRYVGQSFNPTSRIDVFVTDQSIKRPFEYIGKGYIGGIGMHNNQERIQKQAEKLGKEKGADAVLIMDYYAPDTGGTDIISASRTDSVGRGTVTTRHTTISPTASRGYHIMYIKYTP